MDLTALYADRLREGLAAAIDTDRLAEAWKALHPGAVKAVDGITDQSSMAKADPALAAFLEAARAAVVRVLRAVLPGAWTEGWALGQQSAVSLATFQPVDWGAWTPGDPEAAAVIAGPGLAQLLAAQDITIQSIADTRIGELAAVLEATLSSDVVHVPPLPEPLPPMLSVGSLARQLKTVLDDPSRAQMVAHTEIARAQAEAARNSYRETGVTEVQIITAEDDRVCARCDKAEADGPHPLGDPPAVPLHPLCRCAETPVVPGMEPRPAAAAPAAPAPAPAAQPQPAPAEERPAVAEKPVIDTGPAAGFDPVTVKDDAAARRWLRDHQPDLPGDQRAAVRAYASSGYKVINDALRAGSATPESRLIDAAMSPLEDDLVLDRIVGRGAFGDADPVAFATDFSDWAGRLVSDKAYQSAALGKPTGGNAGAGVYMHIAVPKGTRAVVIGTEEREILLDRGLQLAVSRAERAKNGYGWEFWMTVVPGDGTAKAARPEPAPAAADRQGDAVFEVVGTAPEWAVTAWDAK